MRLTTKFVLVLVTSADLRTARRIARAALEARLVACANLVPKIESHYWWKGRIESSAEVLLLFKTTVSHLRTLEKLVLAEHPYETPEFVVLSLKGGTERYLQWLKQSVASPGRS